MLVESNRLSNFGKLRIGATPEKLFCSYANKQTLMCVFPKNAAIDCFFNLIFLITFIVFIGCLQSIVIVHLARTNCTIDGTLYVSYLHQYELLSVNLSPPEYSHIIRLVWNFLYITKYLDRDLILK